MKKKDEDEGTVAVADPELKVAIPPKEEKAKDEKAQGDDEEKDPRQMAKAYARDARDDMYPELRAIKSLKLDDLSDDDRVKVQNLIVQFLEKAWLQGYSERIHEEKTEREAKLEPQKAAKVEAAEAEAKAAAPPKA